MPKAIKKKIVKKTTAELEMKGVVSKIKEYTEKKKNVAIIAAAAILIFIAAVSGLFIYSRNNERKAERLEYEAYKMYYGHYLKQPISAEEQYNKALDLFKKAYDARKSPVSLFYIANCYYETGRYDETLTALNELNKRFPDDERFVPLAYYKMATVSLKKGSSEDALKFLDILYKYKTDSFKDLSLIQSGRILEALGRKEEARKKYEELTKNFPQSPFLDEAQARIGTKKG